MKKSTDSAAPAFWNQRYASGETPWVLHKIPATLRSFLKRTRRKGRVLIPGCGTDHGVIKAFADAGFEVTAIDFSPVALAETKKALGNFDGKIIRADFFKSDFGRRFDLVYERTFLCAHSSTEMGAIRQTRRRITATGRKTYRHLFLRNRARAAALSDQQNTGGKNFRQILPPAPRPQGFRLGSDVRRNGAVAGMGTHSQ